MNKEQKQIMHIAPGKSYYMEFLKDQFWSLIFDIDLRNVFLIMNHENIASYADENTPSFPEKILTKLLGY